MQWWIFYYSVFIIWSYLEVLQPVSSAYLSIEPEMQEDNWCYMEENCWQRSPTSAWQMGNCAGGERQSPININAMSIQGDENGPFINITMVRAQYAFVRFQLRNTGRTIQINNLVSYAGGTPYFTWPEQGDGYYKLHHINLHWGPVDNMGSEHKINMNSFSIEMQLVHYRSSEGPDGFENITDAINSGKENALAVIALMFLAGGTEESIINPLTSNLDMVPDVGDHATVNLCDEDPPPVLYLGDAMLSTKKAYTYMGSLTTPPCSPVVAWIVAWQPIKVSQEETLKFRTGMEFEKSADHFRNNRKIQGTSDDRSVTMLNFV